MTPGLILADVKPEFMFLGTPHVVATVMIIVLPLVLAWIIRRADSEKVTRAILWSVAGVMAINELIDQAHHIANYSTEVYLKEYLPFHLCDISVILIVILLLTRKFSVYEVVFFWGIAGASNSILTPDLTIGFPSVDFWVYFISHGGIITSVLLATWGLKMRPTFGSVVRAFAFANLYAAALIPVNLLVGSNYMFLCKKPAGTTPFFFLDWPWYILFLEPFAFVLFLVVYSPFFLSDQWCRLRRGKDSKQPEPLTPSNHDP